MLKRGSIPVSVLTVMTVVVFAFTLLSFSFNIIKYADELKDKIGKVYEFNEKVENEKFNGEESKNTIVEKRESYGLPSWTGFGKERLVLSVQKLE